MSVQISTKIFLLLFLIFNSKAFAYPESWWAEIPREDAKDWEILPQDAGPGEVVLSKRTPLRPFSNLSEAHFYFDGKHYASIEGLWQMMKYPDPEDTSDIRNKIEGWPYTRDEVTGLSDWESKDAGNAANKIMKKHKINWISYKKRKFNYKDLGKGSDLHYKLIYKAMKAKILQNNDLKELLMETKGLKLIPDHKIGRNKPKSYFYNKILMKIRKEIQ